MAKKPARPDAPARAPWAPRVLPIGLLALALGSAPVMVFSREGLPRLGSVEKELGEVERENLQLRRDIDALRARVRTLREDPAAVEGLARDDLGLVRQTEVVFQFPQ